MLNRFAAFMRSFARNIRAIACLRRVFSNPRCAQEFPSRRLSSRSPTLAELLLGSVAPRRIIGSERSHRVGMTDPGTSLLLYKSETRTGLVAFEYNDSPYPSNPEFRSGSLSTTLGVFPAASAFAFQQSTATPTFRAAAIRTHISLLPYLQAEHSRRNRAFQSTLVNCDGSHGSRRRLQAWRVLAFRQGSA